MLSCQCNHNNTLSHCVMLYCQCNHNNTVSHCVMLYCQCNHNNTVSHCVMLYSQCNHKNTVSHPRTIESSTTLLWDNLAFYIGVCVCVCEYSKHFEVKRYRWLGCKDIVLTSNRHPNDAYNLPDEDIKQLLRRLDYIIEFTSNDTIIHKEPKSLARELANTIVTDIRPKAET